MAKNKMRFSPVIILLVSTAGWVLTCGSREFQIQDFNLLISQPRIEPDYSDVVIPPNIAPLNFVVNEEGEKYVVKIYGDAANPIVIRSKTGRIEIPRKKWKRLLDNSRGKSIHIDVFTYNSKWSRYQQMSCRIAPQPIDRYLVYRFFRPNYTVQQEMTIRQRDLNTFDESVVFTTRTLSACVNCHCFNMNDPGDMLMHVRWGPGAGTLFAQRGEIHKVDTRTDFNESSGVYPSWHPDGKQVAFSTNRVYQFFHASGESRDVIDVSSDIIIYRIERNAVTSSPAISTPDFMETFPTWTPNGRFLYFCRAPQPDSDFSLRQDFRDIKYDLMRIGYDPETETWGKLETLISARETDLSCSHPRISPDGDFLLFCMSDYGSFPIFQPSGDLYLMTLSSGDYHRLDINSTRPEGYHSWSSNSRWIVFTSKRDNGVFTRLYISYVDDQGVIYKPFILPQKDPTLNQRLFYSFSVPELITKPINFTARRFIAAALDSARAKKAVADPDLKKSETGQDIHRIPTTDYP
jgi:hypothetical protein